MATADTVRNYVNAAEITNYWIKNVNPRYFNMENVNTYRAGTLGLITDILSTTSEDTVHAMMIARREFYPNTAQYTKSLYKHAAARFMSAPMATPATANVLLMIQQSDILKYGTTEGSIHTFVLDDTFIAHVGDIPFMLDYPIKILSVQRENGKYAHTTHYDFYIDNSLSTSSDRYLPNKVMNYKGTDYVIIAATMRQISKKYDSALVTSNTVVNTVTMDFNFDGDLANFEVFYKQDDTSSRVQLEKRLTDSGISKNPFCWYTIVDNSTIRLTFPANAYFMPRLNSTISIEIATTLGEGGNFDTYDSDIISENASTRYPYNTQVPVFGTVDGASTGGASIIEKEEFRTDVMRAYCTNHTYITVHDLQLYFDQLMVGTNDRFKFVPKRDDAFIRLYGAFLLMKDSGGNVVPTNTLDIELDPLEEAGDFDLYSDVVKRYIIKPGALFTYKHAADDDMERFVLKRIHGLHLSDDLSAYDQDGGFWLCNGCGNTYDKDELNAIVQDACGCPCESVDIRYQCPNDECLAEGDAITNEKFIFTNPYLISVSIDNFMAGYFLNSVYDHHDLCYTAVNDLSIVQFIAKHFKVERRAISGENFYRFSVALSPSVDINQSTIFQEQDYSILAMHNGYVKSIEHNGTAVYATIVYTDDDTMSEEIPEDEKEQVIQVSSYLEKVDQYFYICPVCGKRLATEEWETAKEAGFLNEDGSIMTCPDDAALLDPTSEPTPIENYEYTYVDYDYIAGNDFKFAVGDHITKNDVLATAKPIDLGRVRLVMDLGGVMESAVHRYIPLTIEEAHEDGTPYYIFAAYISTNDMIDSKHIMSIDNGYVMTDGSSGKNRSLSIPIEGLSMELHAFYQYREDDGLDDATRNPKHAYSSYHYMSGMTFTNTYSLRPDDSITLIRSLDNAKGFLDIHERPQDPVVPPEEPDDPNTPSEPSEPTIPTDHPLGEYYEQTETPDLTVYLRTVDHERFLVEDDTDDRITGRYLTVDKDTPGSSGGSSGTTPGEDTDQEENGDSGNEKDTTPIVPTYPPEEGVYGENFLFRLRNCPVVAANWIKTDENEEYFIQDITQHYDEIEKVLWALENAFSIDMKYYNTYGKSKFYMVGNGARTTLVNLDSVNITIAFGIALNFPASADVFRENFRNFVQDYIEATDEMVGNGIDLYIMNLIAAAKTKFDEILYMEYYGINDYDYSAQRLIIMSDTEILETVKPDSFVPEFLNIVMENTTDGVRPKVKVTLLEENLS